MCRDPRTVRLVRQDRCIVCGQAFEYTDETINGESFDDSPPGSHVREKGADDGSNQ